MSPLNTLVRGYSITLNSKGHNISSITELKVDDSIHVKLKDGIIDATVTGIQKEEEEFNV